MNSSFEGADVRYTYPEAASVAPAPEQSADPLLYRMVVGALALVVLATVIGGLVLAGFGVAVPDGLVAVGAGAGGALGGMLVPKAG